LAPLCDSLFGLGVVSEATLADSSGAGVRAAGRSVRDTSARDLQLIGMGWGNDAVAGA